MNSPKSEVSLINKMLLHIVSAFLMLVVMSVKAASRNAIKHDINWNPSITEG